jgi:hypothetical protein
MGRGNIQICEVWESWCCAQHSAGCAVAEPKKFMTSEFQDDATCRSFMKHKAKDDDTTYAGCRQSLIDIANTPVYAVPAQPNVTVIINQ